MTNSDMREFLCQMEQFLMYIDDAMNSPELTDFDALNGKLSLIRKMIADMEPVIGIHRKGQHESRKNDSSGQASTGPQRTRKSLEAVDAGKPGSRQTRSGASSGLGKTRGRG